MLTILLICGLFAGCQNTEAEIDIIGESSTISVDDECSSELDQENDSIDKETTEKEPWRQTQKLQSPHRMKKRQPPKGNNPGGY